MENELLENIELMEDYVEGNLNAGDRQRFELALKTDVKLQEELLLYKIVVAGIRCEKEVEIRARLTEIDHELDAATANVLQIKKNPNNKYFPLIAASVTFLLLAGAIWVYKANYSKQALINRFTVADPGLPVLMGVSDHTTLDEIMSQYKQGHYENAYNELARLAAVNLNNDTLEYYSGVLLMKLNRPQEAVFYFKKTLLFKESIFRAEAEYRLGMALWETDDNAQAHELFDKMSNTKNHPYKEQAQAILRCF